MKFCYKIDDKGAENCIRAHNWCMALPGFESKS